MLIGVDIGGLQSMVESITYSPGVSNNLVKIPLYIFYGEQCCQPREEDSPLAYKSFSFVIIKESAFEEFYPLVYS